MSDLIRFSATRRTARAALHGAWLDGGALKLYTTPVPAGADTALTSQTLLAVFEMPDPAGSASGGAFAADTVPAALALDTGSVAFGRAFDSAGTVIGDYDAGAVGSGAAIEMDNLALVAGSLATITSFVVTEG